MKVITLSPTADTASEIALDEPTNNILIKNFTDGDLFFKFATEENYARIPSGGYQFLFMVLHWKRLKQI